MSGQVGCAGGLGGALWQWRWIRRGHMGCGGGLGGVRQPAAGASNHDAPVTGCTQPHHGPRSQTAAAARRR
eukprot:1232614-Pyramimonas_sp.AAC.1